MKRRKHPLWFPNDRNESNSGSLRSTIICCFLSLTLSKNGFSWIFQESKGNDIRKTRERRSKICFRPIYTKLRISCLARRTHPRLAKVAFWPSWQSERIKPSLEKIFMLTRRPRPCPANSKSQDLVGQLAQVFLLECNSFCSLLPCQSSPDELASCSPVGIGRTC